MKIIPPIAKILVKTFFYTYRRDAALVKKHTDAELTKEQFKSYKNQFTLREKMGASQDIYRAFNHHKKPNTIRDVEIMNDVLTKLADAGVVIDLQRDENGMFFHRMAKSIQIYYAHKRKPQIVAPYRAFPQMQNTIIAAQKIYGIKPDENGL